MSHFLGRLSYPGSFVGASSVLSEITLDHETEPTSLQQFIRTPSSHRACANGPPFLLLLCISHTSIITMSHGDVASRKSINVRQRWIIVQFPSLQLISLWVPFSVPIVSTSPWSQSHCICQKSPIYHYRRRAIRHFRKVWCRISNTIGRKVIRQTRDCVCRVRRYIWC